MTTVPTRKWRMRPVRTTQGTRLWQIGWGTRTSPMTVYRTGRSPAEALELALKGVDDHEKKVKPKTRLIYRGQL